MTDTTITAADVSYVGQCYFAITDPVRKLTRRVCQPDAEALIGVEAVAALIDAYEANRAAARAPSKPAYKARGRYTTGYGRYNNSEPFAGMRGFGERVR